MAVAPALTQRILSLAVLADPKNMDANTARTILDLRNAVKLCELRQISGGRW